MSDSTSPTPTTNDTATKAPSLVVISRVRSLIQANEMNCSESALKILNEQIEEMVKKACENAKKRKRKTVKDCDFGSGLLAKYVAGHGLDFDQEQNAAFESTITKVASAACDRAVANKRKRLIVEDF